MTMIADMKELRRALKNAKAEQLSLDAECKVLDKTMRTKRGQQAKLITLERSLKTQINKLSREIEKEDEL